ncbi:MAG TPA: hypothetical protein HPP77_07100 [Candidatus Hydrogenedentes bacterium]|nr:hypothetical protein [Candidatus Hydrogenedentota bacterium]
MKGGVAVFGLLALLVVGCAQPDVVDRKSASPIGDDALASRPPSGSGSVKEPYAPAPPSSSVKPGAKATLPVRLFIAADDAHALALDKTMRVSLRIHPEVDAARVVAHFTQSGGVVFESDTELKLGAAESDRPLEAHVAARLAEPGKTELRGWAEAYDENGKEVFAVSRALYLIISADKVLVGDSSFQAVELAGLERQREAGEITAEEYAERQKCIRAGGATESIRVSLPEEAG